MCEEKTELMSHEDVRDLYFKYVSDFKFKDESGFVWNGFMPELDNDLSKCMYSINQGRNWNKCDKEVLERGVSMTVKQSIQALFNVQMHKEAVEQFAYDKYMEDYSQSNATGHSRYDGFDVVSEDEIRIKYVKIISGSKCNGSSVVKVTS